MASNLLMGKSAARRLMPMLLNRKFSLALVPRVRAEEAPQEVQEKLGTKIKSPAHVASSATSQGIAV
jgi:hypothetical protein